MREAYQPSRNWRMGPFWLNPLPYLQELAGYNPSLPLSHALSSKEVRDQVHENLAASDPLAVAIQQPQEVEQDRG